MPTLSHRLRTGLGLLLGLTLGIGLCLLLQGHALRSQSRLRLQRESIVTLDALVAGAQRADGAGEALRNLLESFASLHPEIEWARVLSIRGAMLEASTAPHDQAPSSPPRRLTREEKPLYDLAQSLRSAVQTNRQEGIARKEEIEAEEGADGRLTLAAPLEQDGQVVGMVQIRTAAAPGRTAPSVPDAAGIGLAALLLYGIGAFLARGRAAGRVPLTIWAALLLAGAVLGFAQRAGIRLSRQAAETEQRVATAVADETAMTREAMGRASIAPEPPLSPDSWDRDVYGRPRGVIGPRGIAPGRLPEVRRRAARVLHQAGWGNALLALAVFFFVALGLAGRTGATLRRFRTAYAYTIPAILGMVLLVFLPFLYGIALSFTDKNIYNTDKPINQIWVGFHNFASILGDLSVVKHTAAGIVFNYQNFYWTLGFTILWTVTNVAIGVTVGLTLALILNSRGFALRRAYRVLLILPWAMPNYITSLIWRGMFHQQFGSVNQVIQIFGGQPVAWFEKTGTSFVTVLATNSWLSFPFMMVICLGALQSIPSDLYEAARVDGASRWQQFTAITLPSLKPALVPAVILSVIWTFNMFNVIYLVSGGEPAHSTELLITQAYKFAFEQYRYGYAAAYSTVIFAILLIYGVWQNKVTRATEGI